MQLSTYVDDLALRCEGTAAQVLARLSDSTSECVQHIKDDLLTVSGRKSVVVASAKDLANKIQNRLAGRGVTVRAATHARDLGCDAAGDRVRRMAIANRKLGVLHHILKGGKEHAKTVRLWRGAMAPVALYAATVRGLSHGHLLRVRRLAAASAGGRPAQRCVTTTIAVAFGEHAVPAAALRCDVIFQWITLLHDPNFDHGRAVRAWQICLPQLRDARNHLWRKVTGPLSTCVAVLLDLGWNPSAYNRWFNRNNDGWEFDSSVLASKVACAPLLNEIRADAIGDLWGQSCRAPCWGESSARVRRSRSQAGRHALPPMVRG